MSPILQEIARWHSHLSWKYCWYFGALEWIPIDENIFGTGNISLSRRYCSPTLGTSKRADSNYRCMWTIRKKLNLNYSEYEAPKKNLIGTNGSEHHGQTSLTEVYVFFLFWYTVCNKSIAYQKHFIHCTPSQPLVIDGGKPQGTIVNNWGKLPGLMRVGAVRTPNPLPNVCPHNHGSENTLDRS